MPDSQPRTFKKNVLPFILATGGEFAAIYFWLWFFFKEQHYGLALLILLVGFLVERLAVLYWVRQVFGAEVGIAGSHKAAWQRVVGLLMITVSEMIVWAAWFFIDRKVNPISGVVVLIVGEQLQHSWDLALLNGKKIQDFLFHPTALVITAIEAGGGILMLYFFKSDQINGHFLIGGAIMLTALTVEHVVQGSMIRPAVAPVSPLATTS